MQETVVLVDGPDLRATFWVEQSWDGGFIGAIEIENIGPAPIGGWSLTVEAGFALENLWNGVATDTDGGFRVDAAAWNAFIEAGTSITFGFQGVGEPTPPTYLASQTLPPDYGSSIDIPPDQEPPPAPPPDPVPVDQDPVDLGPGPGALRAAAGSIVDADGAEVRIAGVNWFGLETPEAAPHGLHERNWRDMLDQIRDTGFNTVRLPFAQDALASDAVASGIDYDLNPDLAGLTPLGILDAIVDYAGEIGLGIILDNHRVSLGHGAEAGGLWHDAEHSDADWVAMWTGLAERYSDAPAILGADLFNEPHGPATWGSGDAASDWRLAAERAGAAIQETAPEWLIFVEGIERHENDFYWWGGNLMGAEAAPIRLPYADKLVYAPHAYPNSIYSQPWFEGEDFAAGLPDVWSDHFGYLAETGQAPVMIGEFGSTLEDAKDIAWMDAFVDYLNGVGRDGPALSWTFWSWNPNSGDTGGVLADDWTTPHFNKLSLLANLMADALVEPSDTSTVVALDEDATLLRLEGGQGTDRLDGGAGADLAHGYSGDDRIFMEAGDDVAFGQNGDDALFGGAGDDKLIGGAGSDTLYGGGGADALFGGDGDDFISGGDGDDVIDGRAGADLLFGGAGADRFVFRSGHGDDTIFDFNPAEDRIVFRDGILQDLATTEALQSEATGYSKIATQGGFITLIGIHPDSLGDVLLIATA